MSAIKSLEDTNEREKTAASANIQVTGSPLNSGAAVGAASNAPQRVTPENVSSQPSRPYNPLLILATLLEQECFKPASNEVSSRVGGYQKSPPSSTNSSSTASAATSTTASTSSETNSSPKKKKKPGPKKKKPGPKKNKRKSSADDLKKEAKKQVLAWNINKRGNDGRIVEAAWNKNYEVLVRYYAAHGDSNVPRSYHNKQLSGWVKRQRNNLKDGKLSSNQITLLNNLDFVWNRTDGQWYKKYCSLVQFQQKFGHCYVTAKYDRSLAEWTQRQRREYKTRPTKISKERLRKLEALEGWSWEKLKEQVPERHIEFEKEMDEIEKLQELERKMGSKSD